MAILIENKEKNISIGEVWKPIISSGKFPNLAKVLRSVLSIFHGTASVEGAINITRNMLSEQSHRLTDGNLNAKKIVKSAIKAKSKSNCCYDHDISNKKYQHDCNEDIKLKAAEIEGDEDKEVSDRNDSEKFDKMEGKSMELRAEEVIWMKRRRANVDNDGFVKKKKVDSP